MKQIQFSGVFQFWKSVQQLIKWCHKALQLMPVFMRSIETHLSKDCYFLHLYSTQHCRASSQTLVQSTARSKSNN